MRYWRAHLYAYFMWFFPEDTSLTQTLNHRLPEPSLSQVPVAEGFR